MTPPTPAPLANVTDVFLKEVRELESVFSTYPGHRLVVGPPYDYRPLEDGCLVSLWDAWSRFLRTLVLACAAGETLGLSGTAYVPSTPRGEGQVLADLIANKRGNNFAIINGEPKWNNIANLTSIVTFLNIPNANVIVGAVSSTSISLGPLIVTNPLEEIRKCRNFVAHKSPNTRNDIQPYFTGPYLGLKDHVRQRRSGVETFSEWCECLVALAGAAAQ
jgi:hypothetical protein